jgi:hypothetical protein
MKLTNLSQYLISFFNNNCLNTKDMSLKTKKTFINLYEEIKNAENYLYSLKIKNGSFYKIKIKDIHQSKDITKPQTFDSGGFPKSIVKYIDENIKKEIEYSIFLLDRNIKIYILLEDNLTNTNIYNNYVDNILIWIIMLNNYASKKCAPQLKIFLYFTNLQKEIPTNNIILNETHANTAFTYPCPTNSEIVVYRKEEWFKVFLHETFHNLGLDFSDMNNDKCNKQIKNIFPINSDINLYEAYAEFWAKIMNVLFCSYLHLKNKNDVKEFLTNCEILIKYEKTYSCFQMIKVLDFMKLTYKNLYQKGIKNAEIRNRFYKEETNIFAYYVITFILLDKYEKFIEWCLDFNTSLLQFKKTTRNQMYLCKYIIENYKSKNLLDDIDCVEDFYNVLKKKMKNNGKDLNNYKKLNYILNNMRMTICELR